MAFPFERHSEAKYGERAQLVVFDGIACRETPCSAGFEPIATLSELRAASTESAFSALLERLSFFDLTIAPTQIVECA